MRVGAAAALPWQGDSSMLLEGSMRRPDACKLTAQAVAPCAADEAEADPGPHVVVLRGQRRPCDAVQRNWRQRGQRGRREAVAGCSPARPPAQARGLLSRDSTGSAAIIGVGEAHLGLPMSMTGWTCMLGKGGQAGYRSHITRYLCDITFERPDMCPPLALHAHKLSCSGWPATYLQC